MQLVRQGQNFEILFGDEQLMGSWEYGSEQALATLVFPRLRSTTPKILIGGLGMGFTLAAARSQLPKGGAIVVAELVPKVAAWATSELAHIFGDSLMDPRVSLEIRDVHDVIVERTGWFDAILLDVDNGPDALINLANDRLYCNWGLRAARDALKPGGVLAIWSSYPDTHFSGRLQAAGFRVEVVAISAGSDLGRPDTIWLATSDN